MKKENIGYFILSILAIVAIAGIFLSSSIEQNNSYHNFSDADTLLNIPNFWNVVSNLPFLVVGLLGIYKLNIIAENKTQYLMLFLGISLVSIGSGYYHLNPNNNTLVCDRLPMTIGFMALFSIVISEFINKNNGQKILIPLLIFGLFSVYYWVSFKDLRIYLLIQFFPLLAIPIILIFFKSTYTLTIGYWLLLLAYVVAKIFEYFDYQIHDYIGLISGHTLKHLFASIGLFILFYTYIKRRKLFTKKI